jgi:hypothetical protein
LGNSSRTIPRISINSSFAIRPLGSFTVLPELARRLATKGAKGKMRQKKTI